MQTQRRVYSGIWTQLPVQFMVLSISLLKRFWYVVNLEDNLNFTYTSHSDIPLLGSLVSQVDRHNYPFHFSANIPR